MKRKYLNFVKNSRSRLNYILVLLIFIAFM